jgi:lipoteichoic acid synthase
MAKMIFSNNKNGMLLLLSMLHLLFMHYFFYLNGYLEWTWLYSEIINLCSVVFDVFILILLFLFLFWGWLKPTIILTYIITFLWSFVNVIYGRFFFQYMSLSAIGEVHGLGDGLVINSVLSAFHWYDLFYLLSFLCFAVLCRGIKPIRLQMKSSLRLLLIPVLSLIITFLSYSAYHFIHPHYRNNWDLFAFRAKEFLFDSVRGGTPNLAHFQTGCVRVSMFEIYDMFKVTELNSEQKKDIFSFYKKSAMRTTHHQRNPEIRNVIFVLLESFLSAPIDMKVDGKEITPFLNSLKRDSNVYYNGLMKSDIGCGESGDGQFIYMTGILPLRHKMTVGQVKNNTLPALPKVLKKKFGIKHTEIIYPTAPNLWQQADMNIVYGIADAFSIENIVGSNTASINDEKIFAFASRSLNKFKEPFFSLILSVSMHSPYDHYYGEDYLAGNNEYSTEYKNYLNTCHYTDSQLKSYFEIMKRNDLFDSSLIIIAADHYAHLDMLKNPQNITDHTPLFIINGGFDKNNAWSGECHQLDVYTTILDVLNIESDWKGLGHTLLSAEFVNSVTDEASRVSQMIIEGDYFGIKRNCLQ